MTEFLDVFTPDWISPPGETISDLLEEKDWTQAELAQRLGYTTKHVSQLINGKVSISEETARKLSYVLGSTVEFWLNREAQYRTQLVQQEEIEQLASWVNWLEGFPLKELMNLGFLSRYPLTKANKPNLVKDLLCFFGVASPDEWEETYNQKMSVYFRRTRENQSDIKAISTWLRLGEIQAEKQDWPKYQKTKFKEALTEIRKLTVLPQAEFESKLKQLCFNAGVILVLVPSLPRTHTSGVARWLNPHRPLIQLSCYGKFNDRFWFSFFHEAAHILLHNNKQDIFLDDFKADSSSLDKHELEREANLWAGNFLIPTKLTSELAALKSKEKVKSFAQQLGIHPGILVGRLQHDKIIEMSWMNDLKDKLY